MKYNKTVLAFISNIQAQARPSICNLGHLQNAYNLLWKTKKNGNKVFLAGNGASASIASHVAIDLTKSAGIEALSFNEPNLITCFSNDFGYKNWISQALAYYAKAGDCVVLISSSGQSKNIVTAAKKAKRIGCKVITFTGFLSSNPVKKLGHINIWANSKNYNVIETIHQIWLLSLVERFAKKS